MSFTDQSSYDICCEWGIGGVNALAECRTFIVVDVLSFSTCVSVAASRGVEVFPYPFKTEGAAQFAERHGAVLAVRRGELAADALGEGNGYSLSPASLLTAPAGLRLVLPSPNGATISLEAAGRGHVLAGCLRNRAAVCARAAELVGPFAIIPAGERWPDGSLRPSLEDWIGAGAIAAMLPGTRSPEAEGAVSVFEAARGDLFTTIAKCSSGRELTEIGFRVDVELAAHLDEDEVSNILEKSRFRAYDS